MKHFALTLLLLLATLSATAGPVSLARARQAAALFLGTPVADCTPAHIKRAAAADTATDAYYIFHPAHADGFVIIAADDRLPAVLGHVPAGTFRADSLPPQLHALLGHYEACAASLPADAPALWKAAPRNENAHILATASWGQGIPFNNLCPFGALTGCVATAMSIIMNYHGWPLQGEGTHSYTLRGQEISCDFTQTYRWNRMRPTYTYNTYTDEEADAVARLMQACGTALNTEYTSSGSASSNFEAALAFPQYFRYPDATYENAAFYSADEWAALIRAEIDAARLVLYGGVSTSEGHSFVIDGYNADGLFHINWGWSGAYNGFFALTHLAPGTRPAYNDYQDMVIRIAPDRTSLAAPQAPAALIRTMPGHVSITAPTDTPVCIYTLGGTLLYSGRPATIPLPARATYLIRVGDTTHKVSL